MWGYIARSRFVKLNRVLTTRIDIFTASVPGLVKDIVLLYIIYSRVRLWPASLLVTKALQTKLLRPWHPAIATATGPPRVYALSPCSWASHLPRCTPTIAQLSADHLYQVRLVIVPKPLDVSIVLHRIKIVCVLFLGVR